MPYLCNFTNLLQDERSKAHFLKQKINKKKATNIRNFFKGEECCKFQPKDSGLDLPELTLQIYQISGSTRTHTIDLPDLLDLPELTLQIYQIYWIYQNSHFRSTRTHNYTRNIRSEGSPTTCREIIHVQWELLKQRKLQNIRNSRRFATFKDLLLSCDPFPFRHN